MSTHNQLPNIIFVGRKTPLTKINNGMETIELPPIDEQARIENVSPAGENGVETTKYTGIPFYHERASTIIRLFSDRYKKFVRKGK